eukprot:CAMPEP_0168377872 /NCGR_PEP_ID=MMETSP0228-20121227/11046_1 /TAXON_ID=133427 /ORGANISM="Protoceratium reticulatum, Strain CCCM 535 (=CCMP 1889)" /LENGTH=39 /DNA_ID= /DNA_START= /DNA_END= /DNA_ORIENTATION=
MFHQQPSFAHVQGCRAHHCPHAASTAREDAAAASGGVRA